MLTKGYIVDLPATGDNKYRVRIPIFETSGVTPTGLNSSIFECTLCYTPGITDGYKVGDCVFVQNEDNLTSTFVIMGKLFRPEDKEEEGSSNIKATSLDISGSAYLPNNTILGQDVNKQFTIMDLYYLLSSIQTSIPPITDSEED